MQAAAARLFAPPGPARAARDQILRFRRSERLVHWALAIPFMVCYSTAVILVTVYNPNPLRPFRLLVSWTHRTSGLCLFALPLWTLLRNRHEVWLHLHNVRQVWRWSRDDVKWLFLIGPASLLPGIALPHQGKFNAGEKINFMSVSATYSIYILTGLGIWLGIAAFPCWIVHFSMAACATPLLLGHIAMATVNPDTRPGLTGMITGFVDREWAKHHYHRWYHEHFGAHTVSAAAPPRVVPETPHLVPSGVGAAARPIPPPAPPRRPLPPGGADSTPCDRPAAGRPLPAAANVAGRADVAPSAPGQAVAVLPAGSTSVPRAPHAPHVRPAAVPGRAPVAVSSSLE